MKKIALLTAILFVLSSLISAQTSQIFYTGKGWPSGMWTWPWGFSEEPIEVSDMGYTPGTPAFRWGTEVPGDETQGLFFGFDSGFDLSAVWETDSVYFKLRAPNGVTEGDTLEVWLYDPRWDDWDYAVYYKLPNYQDLNDGEWHQFAVAYKDFSTNVNEIDRTNVAAVSLEASVNMIGDEFYIDDVWIGNPDVSITMVMFNGKSLPYGVDWEAWGFDNNGLDLAEDEGFTEGTPAIVWETSNWDWQGKGFIFNVQDMSYSMTADTVKLKIKAPAGINNLALEFYDVNYYSTYEVARKVLDDIDWDGEWKDLAIPLADFTVGGGFDLSQVYEFGIVAADATIPERLLIDEVWIGNPLIDFTPPPPPDGLLASDQAPYLNTIFWNNIPTESGESYNVYGSMNPIDDLTAEGVFPVALGVPESEESTNYTTHRIYYPLTNGEVSYYYAVETIDATGNVSETFSTLDEPFANVGKARAIVSLEEIDFAADGDLSEWAGVMPFRMLPDLAHVWGTVDDSLDYSAYVYVAMDEANMYVAIDVVDDVFSYREENTQSWWEDEAIEFFFGLYDLKNMHPYMLRGEEPDYRVVFKPYEMELLDQSTVENGTENYYFEPFGESDYVLEAKIPFEMIRYEEDALFTPVEGITIPFEVFATDADVPDGGAEGRVQLGDNPALNPWGDGPKVWTFAWVGMPLFTDVDNDIAVPYEFSLGNNYPNPFNPATKINFSLATADNVSLVVYNSLGEKVATLVKGRLQAGMHEATWNGKDFSGRQAASGIYFYRLHSGSMMQAKKMILLR